VRVYRTGLSPEPDAAAAQNARDMLTEAARDGHLLNVPLLGLIDLGAPPYRALARQVRLKNGAFFLNPDGKLCCYQTVIAPDRGALLAVVNRLVSDALAKLADEALADPRRQAPGWDDESLRRVRRAAAESFGWVEAEPGRVRFTRPATPAAVRELKREFLAQRPLGLLSDNPWGFDQRADRFTISLGLGGGEPIRLVEAVEQPLPSGKAEEALIAHARTLAVTFRDKLTTEGLVDAFLHGQPLGR
jgi:hypothetical protein